MTRPHYTQAELLAQCDPSAGIPEDLREWERAPPVGREFGAVRVARPARTRGRLVVCTGIPSGDLTGDDLTIGVLAEERGMFRVMDDSGEDYLYPTDCFVRALRLSRLRRELASIMRRGETVALLRHGALVAGLFPKRGPSADVLAHITPDLSVAEDESLLDAVGAGDAHITPVAAPSITVSDAGCNVG